MTPVGNSLDVLIIEDNLGDFTLVKEYLQERFQNSSSHQALNYKAAEKLLSQDNTYDVIILDLILPDEYGNCLVEKVTGMSKQIPVIMLTGSLNLNFCIESLKLGVSDYLFKDELNPNSLFKSINFAIEKQKNLIKLQKSEKKYSDLFNLSPVAMFVYDLDTLHFLDVNSAAIDLYGHEKDEFLSMKLQDIVFEKDVDGFLKTLDKFAKKEKHSYEHYFLFKTKSKKEVKAELIVKTIQFLNENARLVVIDDITERLFHFEAIKKQNQLLKEISWQQSHEMRSPASKILGIVEILNKQLCSKTEEKFLIEEIGNSAKELDNVIKSMSQKTKQVQPSK